MPYIVPLILLARLMFWLYKRYGERSYADRSQEDVLRAPDPVDGRMPPRPFVAPEHLMPEGRDA